MPAFSTAERIAPTSPGSRGLLWTPVGSAANVMRSAPTCVPRWIAVSRAPLITAVGKSATATPQIVPCNSKKLRTGRWRRRFSASARLAAPRIRLRYRAPPRKRREHPQRGGAGGAEAQRLVAERLRLRPSRGRRHPRRVEGDHVPAEDGLLGVEQVAHAPAALD